MKDHSAAGERGEGATMVLAGRAGPADAVRSETFDAPGAPALPGAKSWAVAVFMVGGPELGPALSRDLMEMERAGSSDSVSVIVAVQRRTSRSLWFEVSPRDEDGGAARRRRVGEAKGRLTERLDAFLHFVATNHKAQHYLLILWGHASGLGFGRLGPGSKEDFLRLRDLSRSLAKFRAHREPNKLEILAFCACAVSKAEFALELRNEVEFLVSSQVGISTLMTWPFDTIVQRLILSPTVEPQSLASQILQSYEESYEPPPVALTALDLRKSVELGGQVNELSVSILTALADPGDGGRLNNLCVLQAFRKALAAYPYDVEPLVDFFDFCSKLIEEDALDDRVRQQARAVLDRGSRSFVIHNVRSGPKLAALHGLSILAPDFDNPRWLEICGDCSPESPAWLWRNTRWAEMTRTVHAFAAANPDL